MYIYEYSITEKFSNGLDVSKLYDTIKQNNIITTNLENIRATNITVHIEFDSNLSENELNELQNIISNHIVNPIIIVKNIINPSIFQEKINASSYLICSSFIYDGTIFSNILKINILINIFGNGIYDIKIYDRTNKTCLQEIKNLTNEVCNLVNLTNIPNNDSIIDICAKTTANYILIKQINVYLG
jgi:hypothetical protein